VCSRHSYRNDRVYHYHGSTGASTWRLVFRYIPDDHGSLYHAAAHLDLGPEQSRRSLQTRGQFGVDGLVRKYLGDHREHNLHQAPVHSPVRRRPCSHVLLLPLLDGILVGIEEGKQEARPWGERLSISILEGAVGKYGGRLSFLQICTLNVASELLAVRCSSVNCANINISTIENS
jgi:hypothetical protein